MKYTEQKEVDKLGLAARWACTWVGLALNVCEHRRQEKATETEVALIGWYCFTHRLADMANYVNHDFLNLTADQCETWDEEENPEWHYYVRKRAAILAQAMVVMDVDLDPENYQVAIMLTQFKTRHYCILTAAGELINPDPSLYGEIIETRPLLY